MTSLRGATYIEHNAFSNEEGIVDIEILSPSMATNADIDSLLHVVTSDETVCGYILLSPDGIPIRHHDSIAYSDAIVYSSLVCDFHTRAKLSMVELFGPGPDSEVEDFRLRTDKGKEMITTVAGDYLLVVIQKCTLEDSNSN